MYGNSDLVVLKKECNLLNLMRFVMKLGLGLGNGGEIVGDNGVMI